MATVAPTNSTAIKVRNAPEGWRTRRDVEFLNALHPRAGRQFPDFGSLGEELRLLPDACEAGFRAVVARWESALFSGPSEITRREMKVWLAIERRTLKFGKLIEKIPERHFLEGLRDDQGNLCVGRDGEIILPPTGISDRRNLYATIESLLEKRAISRFKSEKHFFFGQSYMYSPINARDMLSIFMQKTAKVFISTNENFESETFSQFLSIFNQRCQMVLTEAGFPAGFSVK